MVSELNAKLVHPTDLNQSYVRMVMISSFFMWVLLNERYTLGTELFREPLFRLVIIATIYACLFLTYAKLFLPHKNFEDKNARAIRYLGIVGDITACAGAVYFAGSYGLLIYPVFITIVIGYGFRFGLRYFFVAEIVALASLVWLVSSDQYLSKKPYLSGALIFGMLIIPTYSAFLLTRYQKVLVQLKETNQARSRFIANISHEFRTPLHAIIINAEQLTESLQSEKSVGEISRSLKIISDSSNHLKTLVDRVLDIASSELRAFELSSPCDIDLFSLITSAVEIGTAVARRKGVHVIYTVEPSVHRFIMGSKKEILEILLNVLGNASKFTEHGYIAIHIKRESHKHEDATRRKISITISDTGCGMSQEQMHSVFEPFVLGDDSSSRHYEGTGIGLTITKRYLDAMNGSINITSRVEGGTSVVIQIPCEIISKRDASYVVDFPQFACVIDDEENDINQEVIALEKLNIDVIPYRQINEFLMVLKKKDCILVDQSLLRTEKPGEHYSALFNNNAPIVAFGTSGTQASWVEQHCRYRISQIDVNTLADVSALCFVSGTPRTSISRGNELAIAQKILLIDDNENNLVSAELVLRNAGHMVDSVTSGDDGISRLQLTSYDLVFIDMHMPQKNGVETVLSARELVSGALPPIIFLTADVTAEKEINGSEMGISAFLTKPITPSSLRAAVDRFGVSSAFSDPFPDTAGQSENLSAYAEIDDMLERGAARSAVADLIENYLGDINRNFIQCAVSAAQEDKKQVRRLVHRMQGSASAMHFDQLAGRFALVEAVNDEQLCTQFLAAAVDLQTLSDTLVKDMKNYVFDES